MPRLQFFTWEDTKRVTNKQLSRIIGESEKWINRALHSFDGDKTRLDEFVLHA